MKWTDIFCSRVVVVGFVRISGTKRALSHLLRNNNIAQIDELEVVILQQTE